MRPAVWFVCPCVFPQRSHLQRLLALLARGVVGVLEGAGEDRRQVGERRLRHQEKLVLAPGAHRMHLPSARAHGNGGLRFKEAPGGGSCV